MIIRPGPTVTAVTSSNETPNECGNCCITDHMFLHSVRYRCAYRRVCTSCVLRLHPQHFCPTCYTVYPSAPPPFSAEYLSCTKCYSFSHIHCLGSVDRSPYTCPLCINPNSPIFVSKKFKYLATREDVNHRDCRDVDTKDAKILLAAAKIAAALMTKNAAEANSNAERRAREAAVSRKRTRDALDCVVYLVAKEKYMKKEAALAGIQGSGSGRSIIAERENINVASNGSMNQTFRVSAGNLNNGLEGGLNVASNGSMNETFRVSAGNLNNGLEGGLNGSPNEALAGFAEVDLSDGELRKEDSKIIRPNDLVPMDVDANHALVSQEDSTNICVGNAGSAGSF